MNGKSSKPHSQPSKKRKFNSSINEYMYNSRDAIPGKDHFTRNSLKARTRCVYIDFNSFSNLNILHILFCQFGSIIFQCLVF